MVYLQKFIKKNVKQANRMLCLCCQINEHGGVDVIADFFKLKYYEFPSSALRSFVDIESSHKNKFL